MRRAALSLIALALAGASAAPDAEKRTPPSSAPSSREGPAPPLKLPRETVVATHRDWVVSDAVTFAAAYTTNASASVFGLACGDGCVFYLAVRLRCEDGALYPGMMNIESGAYPLMFRCLLLEADVPVLAVQDNEDLPDITVERGEVGFTIPLESGAFNVSRFSLKGSGEAVDRAIAIGEEKTGRSQTGLRDFTI